MKKLKKGFINRKPFFNRKDRMGESGLFCEWYYDVGPELIAVTAAQSATWCLPVQALMLQPE